MKVKAHACGQFPSTQPMFDAVRRVEVRNGRLELHVETPTIAKWLMEHHHVLLEDTLTAIGSEVTQVLRDRFADRRYCEGRFEAAMRTSEQTTALVTALVKARANFKTIVRDRVAQVSATRTYTYADLGNLLDAVLPSLLAQGVYSCLRALMPNRPV